MSESIDSKAFNVASANLIEDNIRLEKELKDYMDMFLANEAAWINSNRKLEKENEELKKDAELAPKVSEYHSGVCRYRMLVDGQYFGYIDGAWEKSNNQALSKRYYELGLEGGEG